MNKLIIIGASGHGKVVADIAKKQGYTDIVFLDNNSTIRECMGCPVVGPDSIANEMEGDLFIAVGDGQVRKRIMEGKADRHFPVLIHPSAVIADGVSIGSGSVIMAGAVINPGTTLGKGCILNTMASIDHDCAVGDYVHISVGTHIAGSVKIGELTWIGIGAAVSNNIIITKNCMIGAGTVVVSSLFESGTYIGVPAKRIK